MAPSLPIRMTAFTSWRVKYIANPSSVFSTLFETGVRRFRLTGEQFASRKSHPTTYATTISHLPLLLFCWRTVVSVSTTLTLCPAFDQVSDKQQLLHPSCYFIFLRYFPHHRTMRHFTHNGVDKETSRMWHYALTSGKQLPINSRHNVTTQNTWNHNVISLCQQAEFPYFITSYTRKMTLG